MGYSNEYPITKTIKIMNEDVKEIIDYLNEKEFYNSGIWTEENDSVIAIEITWGDWKHDHLYLDKIMRDKGYTLIGEQQTEHSDCDCYSSIHYYTKVK